MSSSTDSAPRYHVWSKSNQAEGPFELPALVSQVKQNKVGPQSWVYLEEKEKWCPATDLPELKMFFRASTSPATNQTGLNVSSLRRIKLFAEMDDAHLEAFARHAELLQIRQFSEVVKKGDHGDAMYLVLEGELRARTLVDGKEATFNTMGPGDFFGEISLLDHGPRSADIIANRDSILVKISAAVVQKILRETPGAAAPFLYALSRSVVNRVRALTKKYEDSIHFSRTAGLDL